MANIQTYLQRIKSAIYGREVRDSIHDAINAINNEVIEAHDEIDDFVQGEMDTTLTSTTLPAQGKAVGDALANIQIDVDDTLSETGEAADAKAVGDAIDEVVIVSDTEPDSDFNKLWIEEEAEDEYTVPTYSEFTELKNALNQLPEIKETDAEGVDLDLTDPNGNVIARFKDGHIKTKEFDSSELSDILDEKQDALTFDSVPTSNSNNPVTSGGVHAALANKQDTLTFDNTPTDGSNNPVTSGGVYTAIQDVDFDTSTIPEIKESDAESVDLDIADSSGNVILRLANGHIQTKEFNSSEVLEELEELEEREDSGQNIKHTNADGVDLDVTDKYGNVLFRNINGYIQTKNFNSNQSVYSLQFEYNNASGSQTITQNIPKGTHIKTGLVKSDGGNLSSYKVTYSITTLNGFSVTLGEEYGYNFPEYVIPYDAASVTVSYGSNIHGSIPTTLVFLVYIIPSFEKKSHVLEVAADGSKQFISLKAALDSITDNNEENRYTVYIYPGTYNILSYFTAEEIAAEGFKGLWLKNGISLVGVGAREEVILHGELSTDDYTQLKRNDISTINVSGSIRIENMTIETVNLRYGIHDDSASGVHKINTKEYINLSLSGSNLASGGGMERTYGAGGKNWKHVIAKDCDFGDCFALHNDSDMTHIYKVDLENCRARRFTFTERYSAVPTIVNMHNCKCAYLRHDQTDSTKAQSLFIYGEGTSGMMVDCPQGFIYDLGDCHTFYGVTIACGQLVKMDSMSNPGIIATTTAIDAYGVSLGYRNGNTIVQTSGYVNSAILGISNLSVGDYLTINSSGVVVSGGTAENAIAVVKMVNGDGTGFAKLLI